MYRQRRGDGENTAVQLKYTISTDDLEKAYPEYLKELSTLDAPGRWDITNHGALAVTHKGRKKAMGMDDVTYSDTIT